MRAITILLPDAVSRQVLTEAQKNNTDASTLCSTLIAEHFLSFSSKEPATSTDQERPMTAPPSKSFDLTHNFPGFPPLSIELGQRFVDEALKLPGTRAFKSLSGRGVGIEPNFVFIEYLLKRYPGGIGVSFYGNPTSLGLSTPGRNPNYSRSQARSFDELKPLLKLIRRSYQLRFGTAS